MSSGHKPSLCPFDRREGGKECLGKAGKVSTGIELVIQQFALDICPVP